MKWELLLQNNGGKAFELSQITSKVVFTTSRVGTPGKLSISLISPNNLDFQEGNSVRFSVDGNLVFYGFIFSRTKDRWGVREVTAYDQIRYLKTNWTYYFEGKTAGQIIQEIARQYTLTVGTIENTGYAIPHLIQENKSCLDTIAKAIEHTIHNTGKIYVFYDEGGKLTLKSAENMMIPVVLGSKSLLTEYTFKGDIDSETYNQIVLVRPNKDTGFASMKLVRDDKTVAKWGMLQKYDVVNEQMNDAQMAQQANTMLKYYNRALRTLSGECVGDPKIIKMRAGNMIMLNIPDLDDISLSNFVLLDKVTHTYESENHTMQFETRTIYS